jgi:hypothetical protein
MVNADIHRVMDLICEQRGIRYARVVCDYRQRKIANFAHSSDVLQLHNKIVDPVSA